jgi:hypothetical protein
MTKGVSMKAKVGVVSALAATLVLAGVGTAWAGDPRIPIQNGQSEIPPQACGFAVSDNPIVSNEYIVQQTTNPDGSVTLRVTGRLLLDLTNEATGKSITVNASGPATFTSYPDGSLAINFQGPSLGWFTPAAQNQFGVPGLGLFSGHTTVTIDATATLTSLATNGHVTDLCTALQ